MECASQTNKKEIKANNYNRNNHQLRIICSANTLRTLILKNSVRVVDVRKREDYLQSHIPTAVSLPLSQAAFFLRLIDESRAPIVRLD